MQQGVEMGLSPNSQQQSNICHGPKYQPPNRINPGVTWLSVQEDSFNLCSQSKEISHPLIRSGSLGGCGVSENIWKYPMRGHQLWATTKPRKGTLPIQKSISQQKCFLPPTTPPRPISDLPGAGLPNEKEQMRRKTTQGDERKRINILPATMAGPQLKEGRCVDSELNKEFLLFLDFTF